MSIKYSNGKDTYKSTALTLHLTHQLKLKELLETIQEMIDTDQLGSSDLYYIQNFIFNNAERFQYKFTDNLEPNKGIFVNQVQGNPMGTFEHSTKQQAIEEANKLARKTHSNVIVWEKKAMVILDMTYKTVEN